MNPWTSDETSRIAAAHALSLATEDRDGTPGDPVPLGFVTVGGDIYIRAYRGARSRWYRTARRSRRARVGIEGMERAVTVETAEPGRAEEIDAAYRSKYGAGDSGPVMSRVARAATLKLVPR
ncbi:DUF2255 family protein [Streptomyces sp. NPDC056161]|uniref:DUF2255 family protein n=1 Tax=Streptomyces sp. NPDC056161 TaxID=3345732 RepID=UPI0035D7E15A